MFDLIEEAYRVFDYPKPVSLGVCEWCCMDPKVEADFLNPAIRELPLSYVQDWYAGACDPAMMPKGTWGYLLPRVLEILAAGEDVSNTAFEVSLNRFGSGDPQNWSGTEWNVLDKFQRRFLTKQMQLNIEFLDDTICMFCLAGWPLKELLGQVASAQDSELALRLWNDWCRWTVHGRGSIWISAFWENLDDHATVLEFYTSRTLYDRMETLALDDNTDGELAAKASAVASVIEANANWSLKP